MGWDVVWRRILPEKYANVPISFDAAKRAWLKGSMCLAKIDERIESLQSEYKLIAAKVPSFAKFTYEQFVWARLGRWLVVASLCHTYCSRSQLYSHSLLQW